MHERDALAAWRELEAILDDTTRSPRARFEALIVAFFRIQTSATEQHHALGDAQATVAATPEFLVFEQMIVDRLATFLRNTTTGRAGDPRFGAWFAFTVATSVGERMVAREMGTKNAKRVGETTARMLADALGLGADPRRDS